MWLPEESHRPYYALSAAEFWPPPSPVSTSNQPSSTSIGFWSIQHHLQNPPAELQMPLRPRYCTPLQSHSSSQNIQSFETGLLSIARSLLIYLLTNSVMRLVWTKTWTKQMCDLNTFYHWSSCTLLCFGRRIHSVHSMKPIATLMYSHKAFSDETNRSFMQAPQSRLKKKKRTWLGKYNVIQGDELVFYVWLW